MYKLTEDRQKPVVITRQAVDGGRKRMKVEFMAVQQILNSEFVMSHSPASIVMTERCS